MSDRNTVAGQIQRPPRTTTADNGGPFLRRLGRHSLNSTQVMGIMTLLISGAILLLLTGVSGAGVIFFTPIIILTSPIWVPILFVASAVFLSFLGSGLAVVAGGSWLYKYFRGLIMRLADTASHVKDYAYEYGGYFQGKVKDAAPGA